MTDPTIHTLWPFGPFGMAVERGRHYLLQVDPEPSVLILFAHPALRRSRVNRVLADAVRDLPGTTFHDLYEAYPDMDIDVEREQNLLDAHRVIVLQHPVFWYSTPAILKEWQDLVLEHGWAYGSTGRALAGKLLLQCLTTGGREDAYSAKGFNRFTIRQLMAPIEQTATLCGMRYLPPFVVHGTHTMSPERAQKHALDYRLLVETLRDGRLDLEAAAAGSHLNRDLRALVRQV